MDSIVPVYFENRLTGNCKTMLSFPEHLCGLPLGSYFRSIVRQIMNVCNLAAVKPLARDGGDLIRELQRNLYLCNADSRGVVAHHGDIGTLTTSVLAW